MSDFTLTGPDDDGFIWLHQDTPELKRSINLGKVDDVVEAFSQFLASIDADEREMGR